VRPRLYTACGRERRSALVSFRPALLSAGELSDCRPTFLVAHLHSLLKSRDFAEEISARRAPCRVHRTRQCRCSSKPRTL